MIGVHVFTYGSLMIPRVMQVVTGHLFADSPALVQGFARYTLRGETYPGLVEEAMAATKGVLWHDVDEDSLSRLDVFEGEWYMRRSVPIIVDDQPIDAETYILAGAQRHRVSHRRWSRDRFETRYLQRFLASYDGGPDQ